MSDVRTNGAAVGKLCEAQKLIWQAANLVTDARLSTIQETGTREFHDAQLNRHLDEFGGRLMEVGDRMDHYIRELAMLIPAHSVLGPPTAALPETGENDEG